MKILDLVLKGKWFDLIQSGEKKEEYREIKPYWAQRLFLTGDYMAVLKPHEYKAGTEDYAKCVKRLSQPNGYSDHARFDRYTHVRFHRGYTNTTMLFKCEGITIGHGNPAWGAPEEEVFIIKLGKRL